MNLARSPHAQGTRHSAIRDLAALAGVWPVARETFDVAAGETLSQAIVRTAPNRAAPRAISVDHARRRAHRAICAFSTPAAAFGRDRRGRAAGREVPASHWSRLGSAAPSSAKDGQTLEIVTEVAHDAPNASQPPSRAFGARPATRPAPISARSRSRATRRGPTRPIGQGDAADRTATANAKPELEIYADDVKCAHGATVGELDANGAVLPRKSRGFAAGRGARLMLHARSSPSVFVGVAAMQRDGCRRRPWLALEAVL